MTDAEQTELQALRAQIAELTSKVARLEGRTNPASGAFSPEAASSGSEGGLSRRSVLRLAGAGTGAALGAVVLAAQATPAGAANGDAVRAGLTTTATAPTKVVRGSPSSTSQGSFAALWGDQADEVGVIGSTTHSIGVLGVSAQSTGVFGEGGFFGVSGDATFHNPLTVGVQGRAGIGVLGLGASSTAQRRSVSRAEARTPGASA